MWWRRPPRLAIKQPLTLTGPRMSPEALQSFYALMLGFAWAGFLATGYQAATRRPASFRLLQRRPKPSTFAAIRSSSSPRRSSSCATRCAPAASTTGGSSPSWWRPSPPRMWSLMTGTVVVMAVSALHS
jgi:hypothetical protein